MISKYRKKPVVVEAIQLNFNTLDKCLDFCKGSIHSGTGQFQIRTLEGVMTAKIGDYIIKGIEGEFYPCDEEIFKKSYEKVIGEFKGMPEKLKQTQKEINLPTDSQAFNPYQNIGSPLPNKLWYESEVAKQDSQKNRGMDNLISSQAVGRVERPQKGMESDVNLKDELFPFMGDGKWIDNDDLKIHVSSDGFADFIEKLLTERMIK